MARKFNAKTQKWEEVADTNSPSANTQSDSGDSSSSTETKSPVTTTSDKKKADGKSKDANKNFTSEELTYLTGDAEVEPNSVTLSTKSGNTVNLVGLGKYLSGLYFVTETSKEISTSGLTLKYSVLKNGFGSTLKPYSESSSETVDVLSTVNISVGDTVKFIEGVDAVYSNASDNVKVPDWVKKSYYTVSKLSDDGQKALLKEIVSWTYTKYLQKE